MKRQIEKAFQPLVGLPLWRWSRAADMAVFGFGARVPSTTWKGEPVIVSEWALHIQCIWRIVGALGIVVAWRDLYRPAVDDPDLDLDGYDYDGPVSNRRDVRLATLFDARQSVPLVVEGYTADEVGSFQLMLSDGFRLEGFPCHSDEGEHWRLFRTEAADDEWHFVVTGFGIEGE